MDDKRRCNKNGPVVLMDSTLSFSVPLGCLLRATVSAADLNFLIKLIDAMTSIATFIVSPLPWLPRPLFRRSFCSLLLLLLLLLLLVPSLLLGEGEEDACIFLSGTKDVILYRISTSGCHFIRIESFNELAPPLPLPLKREEDDKRNRLSSTTKVSTIKPSLARHSKMRGRSMFNLYSLTRSQHMGDGGGWPTQGKG